MKISIIGNNLTALVLAKILIKKNIKVDLYCEKNERVKLKSIRTIGITQSNVKFLNKYFSGLEKIGHKINKIVISTERQESDILKFENNRNFEFSVYRYDKIYNHILSSIKFERKFKIIKTNLNKILNKEKFLESYDIVIDVNLNNNLSKKFFSKKFKKDYLSKAFVTIINHKKIKNNTARQIFLSDGPLAFLPMSDKQTSIVYSIFNKGILNVDNKKIIETIKCHNKNYTIKSFDKFESFDLKFTLIRNYFKKNVLAFGDKVHTIHPLAGQGFNMSLRDMKNFSKILDEKIEYGLSLDSAMLEEFENKSKYKNVIFANSIDLIHELFIFEKKLPLSISKKLFLIFNKNNILKKYISAFADQGVYF